MCYQTTVNPVACTASSAVTNNANAVTTEGTTTDGPAGNSSGAVSFAVTPTNAQCVLAITKTASRPTANPGDPVAYTITVTNNGTLDYASASPASITDSLTGVLQDASYNNDATASAGTVSYSAPSLSWSGPLAAGATATITYTVTVTKPGSGPHLLINTVLSPNPSNCQNGSSALLCTVSVPVSGLALVKSVAETTLTGPRASPAL